jgi:hypothetical protein
MPWRYQPVIVTDKSGIGGDTFCLCEVYFDDKASGVLKSWGQPFRDAVGDDIEDLRGELVRMLTDSYSWVPVRYDDLKVGMTFERALTTEQRESIARLVELVSFASNPRIQ